MTSRSWMRGWSTSARWAAVVLTSCVLASCAFDEPADGTAVVVDSAGVAIVLNRDPGEDWSLSAQPAVRVGSVDGGDAYLLHRVRFAGRLSDGGVAVADAAAHEIRWFDEAGVHVDSFGRRGEGPGEFQAISQVQLTAGDTVVVYDSRSRRVTWITREGGLIRSRTLPPATSADLVGITAAGQVILSERSGRPDYSRTYNYVREELEVMGLDEAGPRTITRMPGSESAWWVRFSDGRPVATLQAGLPFAHVTLAGVAGDHVVTASSELRQLEWYDTSGSLVRLARRVDQPPTPLTGDHRTRYVRHALESAEAREGDVAAATQDARDRLDLLPTERLLPSFDRMLTDLEGRVWLREYVPAWASDQPHAWSVYDRSGLLIAAVRLPSRLLVMHVSDDHVTGVERDEMDVEYVVSYALH